MPLWLILGGSLMQMRRGDWPSSWMSVPVSSSRLTPSLPPPQNSKPPPSFLSKLSKYLLTVPLMTLMILLVIALMVIFLHLMDTARAVYGADSFAQHLPLIVYSFVPAIAGFLFDQIVVYLNDFEKHPPVRSLSLSSVSLTLSLSLSLCPSLLTFPSSGARRSCLDHEAIPLPVYQSLLCLDLRRFLSQRLGETSDLIGRSLDYQRCE
jgi:uncharacterized integral membrane protein